MLVSALVVCCLRNLIERETNAETDGGLMNTRNRHASGEAGCFGLLHSFFVSNSNMMVVAFVLVSLAAWVSLDDG